MWLRRTTSCSQSGQNISVKDVSGKLTDDIAEVTALSEESTDAINVITDTFDKDFEQCTLQEIEYDEEYSRERMNGWAEQFDADEAIVLLSKFYVAAENGSLAVGETYTKWNWILVRDKGGFWELKTWGYG